MLILAGVSLNAIVGDNGIVTMAMKAKIESEKANIKELIEHKILEYNIGVITDGDNTAAKIVIDKLLEDELIDCVLESDGSFATDTTKMVAIPITDEDGAWNGGFEYVIGKSDYIFNIFQLDDGTFEIDESDIVSGEVATGRKFSRRKDFSN